MRFVLIPLLCCIGGTKLQDSLDLLEEALRTIEKIEAGDKGSSAIESLLSNIASFQACSGDLEAGFRTAERIQSANVACLALSVMAEELGEDGNRTACALAFQLAVDRAFKADGEMVGSLLLEIATIQVETDDRAAARKTCTEALRLGKGQGRDGEFFLEISALQARAGDVKGALETALLAPEGEARFVAHLEIAEVQADSGAVEDALKTANAIQNADIRQSALHRVVRGMAKAGDLQGALRTSGQFSARKDEALASIGRGLLERKDSKGAHELVEQLQTADAKTNLLSRIARFEAEAGDFKAALRTAESAPNQVTAYALSGIAVAQAEAGELEAARKTISTIVPPGERRYALVQLAYAQARAGLREPALRTMKEAKDTDAQSPDSTWFIVRGLAESGDIQGAVAVAENSDDTKRKAKALSMIALVHAMSGKVSEARKLAEAQTSPLIKATILAWTASGIIENARKKNKK